jgi:hypothetical protein
MMVAMRPQLDPHAARSYRQSIGSGTFYQLGVWFRITVRPRLLHLSEPVEGTPSVVHRALARYLLSVSSGSASRNGGRAAEPTACGHPYIGGPPACGASQHVRLLIGIDLAPTICAESR